MIVSFGGGAVGRRGVHVEQGGGDPTALETLATGLASGEDSLGLNPTFSGALGAGAINWTNRCHHDPVRKKVWGMAQAHGGAFPYHFELDEATNVCTIVQCTSAPYTAAGHTYDINNQDPETGNRYAHQGANATHIFRWTPGSNLDAWSIISESVTQDFGLGEPISADGTIAGNSEMATCWHPNLYGTGQGGLVIACRRGVAAYNPALGTAAGAFTQIFADSTETAWGGNTDAPACCYSTALDAVLMANGRLAPALWKIDNSTTFSQLATPPLPIQVDSGLDNGAKMCESPDQSTVYLFELNGTARVWTLNTGTLEFELSVVTHPFTGSLDQEDFLVGPLYGYGAFVGIERIGTAPEMRFRVWKP